MERIINRPRTANFSEDSVTHNAQKKHGESTNSGENKDISQDKAYN